MDIAIIGMGVMGRNLAMNGAEKGFQVAVYNRTTQRTLEAIAEAKSQHLVMHPFEDLITMVKALKKPRKIVLMVKAGAAVDAMLDSLLKLLEPGDIVIDAGNEHYKNTDRRILRAKEHNVNYLGMGVSGGEEGARRGPSMSPGGSQEVYDVLAPIFTKMAASVDGHPCVTFVGNGSAGNYVKMVHNGIEYGVMQLIAESYDALRCVLRKSNEEIATVFEEWNNHEETASYLVEITAMILKTPLNGKPGALLDHVKDVAGSKGTGKWTCQEAAERGVPCGSLQAALDSRYLSGCLNLRKMANKVFEGNVDSTSGFSIEELRQALYCSMICCYAQGLMLIKKASDEEKYGTELGRVASIWVGGCIIRSTLLKDIQRAFNADSQLESLMFDPIVSEKLKKYSGSWRKVVSISNQIGLPFPVISASLTYFDMMRRSKLPLSLIQAQRDCFGSHTFQRVDEEGIFHADWKTGEFLPIV